MCLLPASVTLPLNGSIPKASQKEGQTPFIITSRHVFSFSSNCPPLHSRFLWGRASVFSSPHSRPLCCRMLETATCVTPTDPPSCLGCWHHSPGPLLAAFFCCSVYRSALLTPALKSPLLIVLAPLKLVAHLSAPPTEMLLSCLRLLSPLLPPCSVLALAAH